VLLLAINIFPLIWTIYLSFTSYRANRANVRRRDGSGSIVPVDPDVRHLGAMR